MSIEEVLRELRTGPRGLDEAEARQRLQEFGPNEIRREEKVSALRILLDQFKSVLIAILLISAFVSGAILKEFTDAYVILAIVAMNAALGFFHEYKAEKAVEAMRRMITSMALVIRGGRERRVPSRELVPGDLLLIEPGDRVPADARLVKTVSVRADEAPLTGESTPVAKDAVVLKEDVLVAERRNVIFMGTHVTHGRCEAIATATGMNTEFGKIAKMVQEVKEEAPPLKEKVEHLGRQIGMIALIGCVGVILLTLPFGYKFRETFMIGVTMAVSAVPEGLPAVLIVTLSLGAARMARSRALVRRLGSVETLGATTVICSDKTGTLTKNEMTVRELYVDGQTIGVTGSGYEPMGQFVRDGMTFSPGDEDDLALLLRIGALCNNARLESEENSWHMLGDPTEGALLVAAAKAAILQGEVEKKYPRIGEVPFDSVRKRMTTIHTTPTGEKVAYVKGAPEIVLERCDRVSEAGRVRELSEEDRQRILEETQRMASGALRVLAMAYKELPEDLMEFAPEEVESRLIFVGLEGMIDPPREEVPEAVRLCRQAGVKSVMVTGDHKLTAISIAKEIGLLGGSEDSRVLTGTELERLSDEDFEEVVGQVVVYARVSPQHKVRIAQMLKQKGEVVAMTGDGVNDAPALKTADIGVAMGIKGTDVTKEASDMILEDDNFATIVGAVEGGRQIYDNIRKYVKLMITANFDEFFEIAAAALLAIPIPLIPVQILWINLVTDGIPAVALSVDPKEPDIMQRPPRDPTRGLMHGTWLFVIFAAMLDFVSDFIPYVWIYTTEGRTVLAVAKARTVVFTAVVVFEFLLAFNCRSERHSIWRLGWRGLVANRMLIVSVIASLSVQFAIIYVPFLQAVFHTVSLNAYELGIAFLGGSVGLFIFPEVLMRHSSTREERP